ncbi:unnamed protein product [Ceratitis capitata]|uniref:(Mediterranean fruit fly) hypothetical protein n=1 Tax=Ceratitis capitata TaxID=7213 RepID=A0A811VKF4_CERCA|nr:unnamed protein product [Ceratitis capitata]
MQRCTSKRRWQRGGSCTKNTCNTVPIHRGTYIHTMYGYYLPKKSSQRSESSDSISILVLELLKTASCWPLQSCRDDYDGDGDGDEDDVDDVVDNDVFYYCCYCCNYYIHSLTTS